MTFQELNDITGTTKWENIVLRMDSKKSKEYELWLDRATASLNRNIDRLNKIQATYQNLTVMADIIMGNSTNDYTFRQVAKAFDEVASDSSLNISDRSRQVYKTISQAYAQ